jgi:hypothetical protein
MSSNSAGTFLKWSIILFFVMGIVGSLIDAFLKIISLSWLPSGINLIAHHRLFDGNIHIDPVIPVIGSIIDYLTAMFINLVDLALYPIAAIPGLKVILYRLYSSPDWDLPMPNAWAVFHFSPYLTHRSFFSHSVLNPMFILYILAFFAIVCVIVKLIPSNVIQVICIYISTAIGLSFPCHLLADSMPQAWAGSAFINFKIMGSGLALGQGMSELWLYLNAFLAIFAIFFVLRLGFSSNGN